MGSMSPGEACHSEGAIRVLMDESEAGASYEDMTGNSYSLDMIVGCA